MKPKQNAGSWGESESGIGDGESESGADSAHERLHKYPAFHVLIPFICHCRRPGWPPLCICGLVLAATFGAAADPNQLYREAVAAFDQGRYDDAERLHLQALPLYQATLPPDHELVVTSLHNLGVLARKRGDYATATKRLQEALAAAPAGSLLRAEALNAFAAVLERQKRPLEAEPQVREAIAILEALPVKDYLEIADSLNTLGLLHLELGDVEGAERQFIRARERLAFAPRVSPEFRFTIAVNLAAAVFSQDRRDEALLLYKQVVQEAAQLYGSTDARTADLIRYYVAALRKSGHKSDAKALLRAYSLR